jgi:HK97 family phage portal protein
VAIRWADCPLSSSGDGLSALRRRWNTFSNGITANGVFMSKRPLDAPNMKLARELVDEKYIGAVNNRRPLILNSDMEYRQLTINPDDAQMLESRGFSVEEICRFFGVPPHMIGHTEKASSWGTGIEQMTLGFVKFALRRRLKRIEQALEKQLLSPVERANGMRIEFNLEGLLRGDSQNRATFYASGLQNGWFTINEVRAYENMPPVDGGEVPRMQMQNVPITEAGQQPSPRAAAASQED